MAYTNYYFIVLDIETSKELSYDEKIDKYMPTSVWLSYGVCKLYNIKGDTIKTCKFRKWEELRTFFIDLRTRFKYTLFCFVHNLAYEFDFLIKNVERPKKFICNNSHGVISAVLEKFNIEFRCTYQLSKLPLYKIGEMFGFPKLESDYRTIYEDDEITQDEWDYCERDCDIIPYYIIDLLKDYGMLCRLPLTSTGMVRRKLKEFSHLSTIEDWDLMPPEDCYQALVRSFRGATTMSNPRFTNIKLNCPVKSFDEKSKYPSIMLCKEFPYTIERKCNFDKNDINKYKFWIARVKLINVRSKFDWGVISISTCEKFTPFSSDIFNGKVINSNCIEMYITNVDLDTFRKVYYIDDIEILEFYPCKKYSKLPEQFIELIKLYASEKTRIGKELKIIEKEYPEDSDIYREKYKEYMDAKAKLNGIYGMMVQKLVQVEYYIDENFLWREKEKQYKQIPNKHLGRNFLYGIYITSYSRYDLVNNIVYNCPNNFVYCDTDSIKYIDIGKPFIDLNDDIPIELAQFDYLKGFNKFEEEEGYTEFITYGAKKYAYTKGGHFGFTVAGLPKTTPIHSFNEFKLGSVYKDCKLAKRYLYYSIYTDIDLETGSVIDQGVNSQFNFSGNGGIALYETDYSLNMTDEDLNYCRRYNTLWRKKDIQQNISI